MNVRIVPRGQPQRTDLYVVAGVCSDGVNLRLYSTPFMGTPGHWIGIPLCDVAEILLDEESGDIF